MDRIIRPFLKPFGVFGNVRVVGVNTVDPITAINHNVFISNRDCVLILEKSEEPNGEE